MTNVKRFAIAGAVVAAVVPALAFARKRVKASSARKVLTRAKAEGRKVTHAPKPRRERRIARHLAKSIAATA